ncbi:MAG: ATP-binding protein [Gemmataceae bacterium]
MPRLIVIQGADEGRQFELTGPVLGIGRDASNPLRLHDTEVSRRHAEFRLTIDGTAYRVLDKGSVNGVFVNGQPSKDSVLRPGDQVHIGQTVLVYQAAAGDPSKASDLADKIRMIARQGDDLTPSIVTSIGEAEGSRILARPEDVRSPWLRTRLANLAILYDASQAVSQILDVGQLLDRILELTFRSIEADRGCILLREGESTDLQPKAARYRVGPAPDEPLTISRTITDHVLKHRQGILVADAARDSRFTAGQSILRLGIREAICVPMKGRHETLGVLYLDTHDRTAKPGDGRPAKFTDDHLHLAIALAHQAALAIEETRYYQAMVQAERLAAVGQTIAALSHHIKNILQGLKSGTEILGMGIQAKDDPLLRQGWKIVEKNQGKIYDLVLDMLSYSKEREPAVEPLDLNALAGEVVELMRPRAVERGVRLDLTTVSLPMTPADSDGIHRALLNLIGNALDAVEDRRKPIVTVATEVEPSGEWVRIVVSDNGMGIPADKLDDVFRPFVSSKGSRGTGLGLPVSRKILREHGGDITVQSTPDVGSTFILRLPVQSVFLPATHLGRVSPPEPD